MAGQQHDVALCQQAVARDPQAAGGHYELGMAYLETGRRDDAMACFARATALDPAHADAWYQLGFVHSLSGRFEQAIACCGRALALDPRHAEACNNIGYVHLVQGELAQAAAHFRRAVEARPDYANAHYNLGFSLLNQGRVEEAVPALQTALGLRPDFVEALFQLGLAWLSLNRPQEAAGCLQRAVDLRPDEPEIYYNLGYALSRLGQPAQAEACYRRALALRPDFTEVHYNLGTLYGDSARYDEAVAAFEAVLRLQPDHADAHMNMGTAYLNRHRFDEAIPCYERALALKPDHLKALYNLGTTLSQRGRLDEAVALLERAVACKPDFLEAHYNLGNVYYGLGRLEEAQACYERALSLRPDYAPALVNLGNVLLYQGMLDRAVAALEKAEAIRPDQDRIPSARLLALNYLPHSTPERLWAEHRRFAERFEAPLKTHWRNHANRRDPERRLKIGYVSPDFRTHSVAFFIEPVLAHHDRREVEVFAYYSHNWQDEVTGRLRQSADHWLPCRDLSDEALAERIRADGIDVLIDLAGHTRDNRLLTFARHPAPIQVSYLGYPATTGLSAMDWRLVTSATDPEDAERWHSERLYRLPRTLWCYRPEAGLPEADPVAPARRLGYVSFGSMNNVAKVTDETMAVWAELLHRVAGSRLVMTGLAQGEARRRVTSRFAAQGIPAERLVLHGKLAQSDYYALLSGGIDIALDAWPYNGTTTTCQSLWMGLPVVTRVGETSVSRSGYALLETMGLEGLAAKDEAGYLAIAESLARDLGRVEELRGGLRKRMERSPLRDEAGFTRELEAAYRSMWRDWCGARRP